MRQLKAGARIQLTQHSIMKWQIGVKIQVRFLLIMKHCGKKRYDSSNMTFDNDILLNTRVTVLVTWFLIMTHRERH